MRIAILSAGQSLRQTFDPTEHFDLRIGVNAAAAMHYCDWWSCGDAQTFDRIEPVGFPVLFTMTDSDSQFRRRRVTAERLERHRMVLWSEVAKRVHPPSVWSNWSITAALGLAVDLGAKDVQVYGHDMTGTVDSSGHRLDKRAENWKRVGRDWLLTRAWAVEQGLRINEHRLEQACA